MNLLYVIGLLVSALAIGQRPAQLEAGDPAPNIPQLSGLRGRLVVLDFFQPG